MYFNDKVIVLLRHHFREHDRMISCYSLEHGRIVLRFPGVERETSKLKAFSELFTKSNIRVYLRTNANIGCATGGKLDNVYPLIRTDLQKTNLALYFCELVHRLTPEQNPNPNKFKLLDTSLQELNDYKVTDAVAPAFLLRLMQESGFGVEKTPLLNIDEHFWQLLHKEPLHNLSFTDEQDLIYLNKTRYICKRFLNRYLTYPLYTISQLDLTIPLSMLENTFSTQESKSIISLETSLQPI